MTAAAAAGNDSVDSSNPYSVIVERNIFHLNPPPPPPEPEKPKVELPVIKITGFVNIGQVDKVLFVSQPKNPKEEKMYYSLSEGEKTSNGGHEFELVKIHPSQDAVDVINDGVAVTLTVKDDALAPSAGPAPGPAGRERPPGPRDGPSPRPLFRPGMQFPQRPNGPGGFSFPMRARQNVP
jgi:hypothetical protein